MSMAEHLTQASYLAAAALFTSPRAERSQDGARGVAAGVAGVAAAIAACAAPSRDVSYTWIHRRGHREP
jgi:hypothetical protein